MKKITLAGTRVSQFPYSSNTVFYLGELYGSLSQLNNERYFHTLASVQANLTALTEVIRQLEILGEKEKANSILEKN